MYAQSNWNGHALDLDPTSLEASLYPGRYSLQLQSPDGYARLNFEIVAGGHTELDTQFARSPARTVEVHCPSSEGRALRLDVSLVSTDGVEHNRKSEALPRFGKSVFPLPFNLPPGSWKLEFRIAGELVHTLEQEYRPQVDPIPIVVRLDR